MVFDLLDGKVARWRKTASILGQELDSLADLVSTKKFFLKEINLQYFIFIFTLQHCRYHLVLLQQYVPL